MIFERSFGMNFRNQIFMQLFGGSAIFTGEDPGGTKSSALQRRMKLLSTI
jgi:hypothetical protein